MKDQVLKRKMFSAPMGKGVNNVGIMAGFEDDDEMDDEESSQELSRRTPQSPEILMNNLRGDIRSVDARYEELAQMVGEEAAMETPPEVLAMLQGQMAQQQGIGALPQAPQQPPMPPQQPPMPPQQMPPEMMGGQPPMPPEMMGGQPPMPPEMMAQAPMPMDQGPMPTPQGFADGGIVRLQGGGDPQVARLLQRFPMNQGTPSPFDFSGVNWRNFQAAPRGTPFEVTGLAPGAGSGASFLSRLANTGGRALGYLGLAGSLSEGAVRPAANALMNTFGPLPIGGGAMTGPRGFTPSQLKAFGLPPSSADQALTRQLTETAYNTQGLPMTPTPLVTGSGTFDVPMFSEKERLSKAGIPLPTSTPQQPAAPSAQLLPEPTPEEAVAAAEAEQPAAPSEAAKTTDLVKSFAERVKAEKENLAPMFKELMAGDKNAQEVQALMLLADAGMKLARGSGRPGTSFASELAFAAEGIPAGMAKLAAQKAERETAVNTAALTAAINRIESQDKSVKEIQLKELELLKDQYKLQLQLGKVNEIDMGAGATRVTNVMGRTIGTYIDPDVIRSFTENKNTVNPNTNPFARVESGGAPLLVKDKTSRERLASDIAQIDSTLAQLDNITPLLEKAYGPGSFLSKLREGVFVPLGVSSKPKDTQALSQAQQNYAALRSAMARLAVGTLPVCRTKNRNGQNKYWVPSRQASSLTRKWQQSRCSRCVLTYKICVW
jgi:hypothetical protein